MFLASLGTFVTAFILIKLLIKYAPRLGLIDIPNARSIHTKMVPRAAGVGIFAAFLLACCFQDFDLLRQYPLTFLSFTMVFIIGLLDDLRDTSPRTKFIVIFIATTLSFLEGIGIHSLGTYAGHDLALHWLALPFTLFALSGFTNAMNLIDGVDGLAGTLSIIIFGLLFYIGYQNGDTFISHIALFFILAIAAFLLFNWNPATIFMGDSGSLTVGFVISILFVKALSYIPTASILFLAAVPILDTLVVMVRRKRHGRSAFEADKTHLHHILLSTQHGNVKRTVLILAGAQIAFSITGLYLMDTVDETVILALFIVSYAAIYAVSSTVLVKQKYPK